MIYHELKNEDLELAWTLVLSQAGKVFHTSKGLPFTYHQKTNKAGEKLSELVIDRKEKTITRNTVLLAYVNALRIQEAQGCVSGPKKLGCFGASYLYPIFLELGVCTKEKPLP